MLVLALHAIAAQHGEVLHPQLLRLLCKDGQANGERGGGDRRRHNLLHWEGHVASCHLDNVVRLPGLAEEVGGRAVETERHEEVTALNGLDPV